MRKAFGVPLILPVVLLSCAALAEGSGSQIRSGPGVVAPPTQPRPQRADMAQCDSLPAEAKERCRKEAPGKARPPQRPGAESTGMGSGAGASSATGHGSPGSSGPR